MRIRKFIGVRVRPLFVYLLPSSWNTCNTLGRETQNKDALHGAFGYKQAIAGFEKTDGPDSPGVAAALDNLGQLYRDQEQFNLAQAEPLLQRALAIREKIFGSGHPDTALTLSNLALLFL
jgi:tetratricopeptide (TPR) repeat protein